MVLLAAGAVAAAALGGMLGWMGKRLRAGTAAAGGDGHGRTGGRAAAAPSIGVEPLAPAFPRPDQLAVPVPARGAARRGSRQPGRDHDVPRGAGQGERTGGRGRRRAAIDLAAKKNPF